jgi:predicted CoA-binding protein
MSRVQLANHFKQQAYEVIGVNPQRMGQQLSQTLLLE